MKKLNYFIVLISSTFLLCSYALAVDPYQKPDRSYINITGTVASTISAKGLGFTLDYGDGYIAVEVDDWDWDDDSAGIFPGERVTVSGLIDDDLFEEHSIEASSVYVHNRNTYYLASSADEEQDPYVYAFYPAYPKDGSWISVVGTVKSVNSGSKTFEIDTGIRELDVKVDSLGYNPLDDIGIQKIKKGDRVSVTGQLDKDFLDEDDVIALSIVSLSKKIAKES